LYALSLVERVFLGGVLVERLFWTAEVEWHAIGIEGLKPKVIELYKCLRM
jgi:hypothetical protein